MALPRSEDHRQNNWILRKKGRNIGPNLQGVEVMANYAEFVCNKCHEVYTRIVSDSEFDNLEVGFSNWMWGWIRI